MTGLDLLEQIAHEKLRRLTDLYGGFCQDMSIMEKLDWRDAVRTLEIIRVARAEK